MCFAKRSLSGFAVFNQVKEGGADECFYAVAQKRLPIRLAAVLDTVNGYSFCFIVNVV